MKIVHIEKEHMFRAFSDNDEFMGEIEYSPKGDILMAVHTLTDDRFQGQGVAGKLLDALVAYATESKYTITPYCSYVAHQFKTKPEKYSAVIGEGLE